MLTRVGRTAIVGAVALMALAACSSDDNGGDGWENALVEDGILTIGTTGNFVPYTVEEGGELSGYSVDQCRELADRMGLEPEFVVVEFSGIMTGVQSGRIDVVCSGELSQTEERMSSTNFYVSVPTLRDSTGVMTLVDSPAQGFDDLRGTNVGAVSGAASPVILSEYLEDDVNIVSFPGLAEAVTGLQQGRTEAVTSSNLVLRSVERDNPEVHVIESGLEPLDGGLIISRNEALRDEVNRVSTEMLDDGTIAEMQNEWFGSTALPESHE